MKPQYKDIIDRANNVSEEHHEMEHGSIKQHLTDLQAKLVLAEEELIEREDECEADSEYLSKAIEAVNKVQDVAEFHDGGLTTQF